MAHRLIPALLGLLFLYPALALANCPEGPPILGDATIDFAGESDDLGPAERENVRQLAREAMSRKGQICLYGSGERRRSFGGNLALDRAEAVAFELQMAGVPRERIEVVPPSPTGSILGNFGDEGRVDIVFAP